MNIIRFFKKIIASINDPGRTFAERLFVLLTIVSDIAVFIALIGDIASGENIYEIIVLTVTIILVPIITFSCLYQNRIHLAIRLIIIGMIFVVLPGYFSLVVV